MKKHIHLIRHAKSSWADESLADIERPLNRRGIYTCLFMAQHIRNAGCCFGHVFCSPAVRAQSTISLIERSLPEDFQWHIDKKLYTFAAADLLSWCQALSPTLSEVVIIGHNPGLTDLCNYLSDGELKNIPTCGYVHLTARQRFSWQDLDENAFELTTFLKPKAIQKMNTC
jgi:phosphohistidine phosphatase